MGFDRLARSVLCPLLVHPTRTLAGLLLLLAACNATPPGSDVVYPDAGGQDLLPPRVDPPATTPLETVPIRGTVDGGGRVVIKSEGAPSYVAELLPSGGFCIDTPVEEGTTSFEVFAVADDGRVSVPAIVSVTRDAGVAQPEGARCSSATPWAEEEVCDNKIDDDGNGSKDECDPGCNGCVDDYFEPNDAPSQVPTVARGVYPDLSICPCRPDWFAFHPTTVEVEQGTRFKVRIDFSNADADLDLKLYRAEAAEAQGLHVAISGSSTASFEEIDYLVTEPGSYYLSVVGYQGAGPLPEGKYKLTIE